MEGVRADKRKWKNSGIMLSLKNNNIKISKYKF